MPELEFNYEVGDVIPVTSSLYRVVHGNPEEAEYLQTFYAGERFPSCPGCGKSVRYMLPGRFLRGAISQVTLQEISESDLRPSNFV